MNQYSIGVTSRFYRGYIAPASGLSREISGLHRLLSGLRRGGPFQVVVSIGFFGLSPPSTFLSTFFLPFLSCGQVSSFPRKAELEPPHPLQKTTKYEI